MIKSAAIILLGTGLMLSNGYCDKDDDDDEREEIKVVEDTVPYDQRLGGSGIIEFGLTKFDLSPVKDIVKKELDRGGFDFDENVFPTLGIIGYVGPRRDGLRVGFGGWAGYKSLYSDTWTSRTSDSAIANGNDSLVDSTIQLHIVFAHCGLVMEKSFKVLDKLNLYAGGMLGGGGIVAIEDRQRGGGAFNSSSSSGNVDEWDTDSVDIGDNRIAIAPAWVFDLRAGATYTVTKWLHIGLDGSTFFYYSSSGFQSKYGSFWTVNPGVKLRFVFGTST